MANNEKSLEQVIIKLADGTYEGPYPFKTSSKNIIHNEWTLEELLGIGFNPFIEGDLTTQLAYLRSSVSEILLEQIQSKGVGKIFTTDSNIPNNTISINTKDVSIKGNDPYTVIGLTDFIVSLPNGCLFIVVNIQSEEDESKTLTIHYVTTIVTAIQGYLINSETGEPDKDQEGNYISILKAGNITLNKWDVGLWRLENIYYLPIAGGTVEGDLTVQGQVKFEQTLDVYGNTIIRGNLIVQGDTTVLESEVLKVKDNLIETNSDKISITTLSGLAINKDSSNTYGICYDPIDDTVKLGLGTITEEGIFSYSPNEGYSIVVRSKDLENGKIVKWNSDKHYIENANNITKKISFSATSFNENKEYTTNIDNNYEPIAVYKYVDGTNNYVLINSVDLYKEGNNIKIVSNETFDGFILIIQNI